MFGSSGVPFYLLLVNTYLFILMGYDKMQAKKKGWRIPEWNLLLMGIIGGGIGGFAGQYFFHHKTKKKIFYWCFFLGCVLDIGFFFFFITN